VTDRKALEMIANLTAQRHQVNSKDEMLRLLDDIAYVVTATGAAMGTDAM
jgi:hypothetical protein